MESTMCLGEGQIILQRLSLPFFFFPKKKKKRREWPVKPNIGVLCRSLFVFPTSGSLCRLPIGNRSTLEFSPHHPAMLWPSNSRLLWPEQINNKPGSFHRSSGEKQMDEIRAHF